MSFSISAHDSNPNAEDSAYDDAAQKEVDDRWQRAAERARCVVHGAYGDPAYGRWPSRAFEWMRDLTAKFAQEEKEGPKQRAGCIVAACQFEGGWRKGMCYRHWQAHTEASPIPGCTCDAGPMFCPVCQAILDAPVGGAQ